MPYIIIYGYRLSPIIKWKLLLHTNLHFFHALEVLPILSVFYVALALLCIIHVFAQRKKKLPVLDGAGKCTCI